MSRSKWLSAAALILTGASGAVFAQTPSAVPADATAQASDQGEIIVTATRRSVSLANVPIAVSAISGDAMRNSGVSDIRQLNQLSPSLNVTSSQSEAVSGVARIRGIGTIGDNPGLESSVATFIDGVYRSRSGVALTELGPVERIEVLRGPQGTLFGRNASAGLINIITEGPSSTEAGTASLTYGNYNYWRAELGLTGPIGDKVAYRLDGVYAKRNGFLKESDDYPGASGRRFNNRDRYLIRGQLKLDPTETLNVRLIADYAKRNEDCCAATFLPATQTARVGGQIVTQPNAFAALERSLGAVINDDPFARRVAVTPGRSYRSDVRDWGLSAEANWELGGAKLTSITAYRDWRLDRRQDADFTNLDLLYRGGYGQKFKTFTQELRFQGKALNDKLDWLIGGYFADEKLNVSDDLRFGRDYGLLEGCRVAAAILTAPGAPGAGFLSPGSATCINPAIAPAIFGSMGPLGPAFQAGLTNLKSIGDSGATDDRFHQKDRTWALFTHNVFDVTDRISLTLGARYTHDRKSLDMSLASDSNMCARQRALLGAIAGNPGLPANARTLATNIVALSCANNIAGTGIVDGRYSDRVSDNQWTGTAVISFKPTDRLLTYASYSKGYKAGGFNLDRAGMTTGAVSVTQLRFAPEKVDSFELGAKYRGHGFYVAASAFYELFDDFQLNTFNGLSFVVENIAGCSSLAGGSGADSDLSAATGACAGKKKAGVISKGVEIEGSLTPIPDLTLDGGFTLADAYFRHDISGLNGRPLPTSLFVIPGGHPSNAPKYVLMGASTWTPPLGFGGLSALIHADVRWQSAVNTGSDLFPEKLQKAFAVVNARLGVTGAKNVWSLEVWSQNLFDKDYRQVVANAPVQGSNSIATLQAVGGPSVADSLFITFPAEPRTFGVTVRTRF